jgi:twitching motility two-component system response regulator PilH
VAKKILIVDDEQDARTYLEVLLQEHGFETKCVDDGDVAWTTVREYGPDLITLDIIMPRETGVKFYRQLCKDPALSKIPVIICSGVTRYKELFARDHLTMPKPVAFMEKPLDREKFMETIRAALG